MKILQSFLLLQLLFLSETFCLGQTKITGQAKEYAGNKIELYCENDFISHQKIILGTILVQNNGYFSIQFELSETVLGQADFDGYHAMIYLESNKSYQLVFPPKKTLTESQKRNPFFQPSQIWFGLIEPKRDDLNVLIQEFESFYYKLENLYFRQIFANRSSSTAKTFKQRLDNEFPVTENKVFEAHKKYRKGNIDYALHQGKSSAFVDEYFIQNKPMYKLPAYGILFEEVFSDYFNHLGNSSDQLEIKKAVKQGNLKGILDVFDSALHFPKELSHLVILNSLKDAYYSTQYKQPGVLSTLREVNASDWTDFEKSIAENVYNKLVHLMPGTNSPNIRLEDINGKPVKFSDYLGKLIYLHFTDIKNPICKQHLDKLDPIAEKYKEKLVVIYVIVGSKLNKENYLWSGIYTKTSSNYEEQYKVKTFPSSYLIGIDGKLLWSPAPNPIDGLNSRLSQFFRNERIKELQQ